MTDNRKHSLRRTLQPYCEFQGRFWDFPFFVFAAFILLSAPAAFAVPPTPGTGAGAIGVNAANNLSIGTSTPLAETKLLIVASSTDTSNFVLKVIQPNLGPILFVRNDGSISVATTTMTAGQFTVNGNLYVSGNFTANIPAPNVIAGVFNNQGSPLPFSFAYSLGVATGSTTGLPAALSVYGGGYFSGSVGIGTAGPGAKLDINIPNTPGTDLQGFSNSAGGYADIAKFTYGAASTYPFQLVLGGTRPFVITGGNVGIGTTAPRNQLEVGNATANQTIRVGGIYRGVGSGFTGVGQETDRHQIVFSSWRDAQTNTIGAKIVGINLTNYVSPNWDLVQKTDLAFFTLNTTPASTDATTEKMRLTAEGNVGIGTTTPAYNLAVQGNIYASGNITCGGTCGGGSSQWTSAAGGIYYPSRVSVGTTTLNTYALLVATSSDNLFAVKREGAAYAAIFRHGTDGSLVINTNNIDVLTLKSTGNVGIGTAAPDTKLDISGSSLHSTATVNHYRNVVSISTSGNPTTGTLKITLPKLDSTTMLQIKINGYNYVNNSGAWEILIGGYNYSTDWVNTSITINGTPPFTSVRLAEDASNDLILLGITTTNWYYPKVVVSEVIAGYGNITGWGSGWSMAFITDETGITVEDTPTIKMYVDTAGNVGIGTATPSANLTVYGLSNPTISNQNWTSDTQIWMRSDDNGYGSIEVRNAANTLKKNLALNAWGGNVGIATTSPSYTLSVAGDINFTGTLRQNGTAFSGSQWTTTSTGIYYNAGNVGIGTTGPNAKLSVVGGSIIVDASDDYVIGGSDSTANIRTGFFKKSGATGPVIAAANQALIFGTTNTNSLLPVSGNTFSEAMRITTAGNVGIGTTAPGAKLETALGTFTNSNTATAGLLISGDATGSPGHMGIRYTLNNTTANYAGFVRAVRTSGTTFIGLEIGSETNHGIRFLTNGTGDTAERVRIDNAGNVGIGTTGPTAKLDVNGSYSFGPSTGRQSFYSASYSVPTATQITITLKDGVTTLVNGWNYRIRLVTTGTGSNTGAEYIVYQTAAGMWAASLVSANGTTSNHPLLLVSGTAVNIYHNHASTYNINTFVEGFYTGNLTLTAPTFFGLDGAMTNLAGNVGIGTTNPGQKLEVVGNVSSTNAYISGTLTANKVTANLWDPVYDISGTKYATYGLAMTGLKEETAGIAHLRRLTLTDTQTNAEIYGYTIDFSKTEQGSDLWLWSKTTNLKDNFDKMTVLLTPSFDGRVWYEKNPAQNTLTIYAVPSTTYYLLPTTYEVSYRLSAPRFDWQKWGNISDDQNIGGLVVPEK